MSKEKLLQVPIFSQPLSGTQHDIYLVGAIGNPIDYVAWFQLLRNLGPEDTAVFHINSPGGDAYTAIQLMNAMKNSHAGLVASVEGMCMSAATFVFLQCDTYVIDVHSSFMFHNYSGGVYGKGGELYDSVVYDKTWASRMYTSMYTDFLTKTEIKEIELGRDVYLGADEVCKRLAFRAKKQGKKVTIHKG